MGVPEIPPKKEDPIRVFQLNDELAEFEELEIDPEMELYELLKSELIFTIDFLDFIIEYALLNECFPYFIK